LQDLTQIIGDNIGDYDKVGILSDNELLVIFPHSDPDAVSQVLQEIKSELSLHLFANIGECAVYLAVECQTPDIQDIDPYIFLSKMSDSLNNNGSNKA
jgi:GGDEF domain-containing protein